MKLYSKIANGFMLSIAVVGTMGMASCADEPDKFESTGGVPTVKYVRCLSSEVKNNNDADDTHYTNGELVTSAGPGSTVALIGDNMRSVKKILFNDQEGSLNTSLLTDNVLISSIPNAVPNEVSDKIFLITTSEDTIAYDFKVIISAPIINSMGCEWAQPGDEQTILGNYFIDDPNVPFSVSFTGEGGNLIPAEILERAADYRSVKVVVPEGAVEGPIVMQSVYGKSESPFYYMDSRGMLFDFDTPNPVTNTVLGNHGWHPMPILADETSLKGNYLQLGDGSTTLEEETWADGVFSFEYWAGNSWDGVETYADGPRLTDIVNFTDWKNMTLKFEVCIPADHPWSNLSLQIIPAPVTKITGGGAGVDIYGNAVPGANNTFFNGTELPRALYRPWTTTGSYDTAGKWVTVSIPLTAFIYNGDGEQSKELDSLDKDAFASLTLFVWKGGMYGDTCAPIIKIDNIRVVPNK